MTHHIPSPLLKTALCATALLLMGATSAEARHIVADMTQYGLEPNTGKDLGQALQRALGDIRSELAPSDRVTLRFAPGRYDFHAASVPTHTYYISNHDQTQPKHVAFNFVDWPHLTIEGNGAEFMFHGRLIPFVFSGCTDTRLQDFSVDWAQPQIAQAEVVANSPEDGLTLAVAPWVDYRLEGNQFVNLGEGWQNPVSIAMAFEKDTRRVVYNSGDLGVNFAQAREIGPHTIQAPQWKDSRLKPGTVLAMRSWYRPAPGIFLTECTDTRISQVKIHYAEGMGLIAYRCDNIDLEGFGVCLRGQDDPRYFTTQADATHFSQCKGKIVSRGGLYENMMDDAINVHGIYLKLYGRLDEHTLILSYEHGQAYGFAWGDDGDRVRFIRSDSMTTVGSENRIAGIAPFDTPTYEGVKLLRVRFEKPLDSLLTKERSIGVENLTWCPEIDFSGNVVRNNRARGALFSSPRHTVCADNVFDHTSGTAVLLCGDCNGWYESGACHDLVIKRNRFINALTSLYQFTNAVISIYPEIPRLGDRAFHGGKKGAIRIVDNEFDTFDKPVLYAKSVSGLVFKDNIIRTNTDYPPFHWNKKRITLEKVTNADIQE